MTIVTQEKRAIDELIASADKLCSTLDKTLENEKIFCHEVALWLEHWNYEMLRMANDLRIIKHEGGI